MQTTLNDLLLDLWNDFESDSEKRFEQLYEEWKEAIQPHITEEFPSYRECDYELNNIAVTKKQFFNFFLKLS